MLPTFGATLDEKSTMAWVYKQRLMIEVGPEYGPESSRVLRHARTRARDLTRCIGHTECIRSCERPVRSLVSLDSLNGLWWLS